MKADPEVRKRLRAVEAVSLDVEAALGVVHRRSVASARRQRIAVATLAVGIAAVGSLAAWQLLPLSRRGEPSGAVGTGSGIAYTQIDGEGETYGVYAVEADGSNPRPVLPAGDSGFYPVWSPDGSRIAFLLLEEPGGLGGPLIVMNADGSDRRTVVPAAQSATSLSWAPDGSRIAYVRSDPPNQAGVWVIRIDGTGEQRVISGLRWRNVAWSPDGSKLLLSGYPLDDPAGDTGQPADLYTVRLDGSNLTRLTSTDVDEDSPSWSPDGSRIAFVRHEYTGDDVVYRSDIYVMNADGSGVRQLTTWEGFDAFPVWSPDGTEIAFSSDQDDPGAGGFEQDFAGSIHIVDAEGHNVRLVLEADRRTLLAPSSWIA